MVFFGKYFCYIISIVLLVEDIISRYVVRGRTVLWYHSYLVRFLFWDSIPICAFIFFKCSFVTCMDILKSDSG